ncbi:TetR/AcrR family transcriptional regulator [Dechloromonas agitata]|uniref:TetR/AcrR family transcriptional regulator n=1 Tax=Dechloromonas agitata TaxID=73030 RepID=UPI000480E473|nr:TetR family transcriptional regulator [Dechloromonas agitata]
MTSKPRQTTESRQAEIIATMVRLSAAHSPADITTTDIANAMSVTQGALFRHFPNKEAIRLGVIDWIEAQLLGELNRAGREAPDALAALEAMFMAHVAFAEVYPGAPRLIFGELQQPDASPVKQRVQQLMQRYRALLSTTLTTAAEAGLVRRDLDGDSAAALFLGGIQGLVIQAMLGGAATPIQPMAAGVFRLYRDAIKEVA